jgi:hypothetical protein
MCLQESSLFSVETVHGLGPRTRHEYSAVPIAFSEPTRMGDDWPKIS